MRGISGAARDPHGLLSGNPESQDMCLEAILFLFFIKENLSRDAAEFLKDFGGLSDAEKMSIKSLTCLQIRA